MAQRDAPPQKDELSFFLGKIDRHIKRVESLSTEKTRPGYDRATTIKDEPQYWTEDGVAVLIEEETGDPRSNTGARLPVARDDRAAENIEDLNFAVKAILLHLRERTSNNTIIPPSELLDDPEPPARWPYAVLGIVLAVAVLWTGIAIAIGAAVPWVLGTS